MKMMSSVFNGIVSFMIAAAMCMCALSASTGYAQETEETFESPAQEYVYHSSWDDIAIDREALTLYTRDIVNVFAQRVLTAEEKQMLADEIGGKVVCDLHRSVNMLQIKVKDSDLNEIRSMAEILMESELVAYAGYDAPIFIESSDTFDNNPWSTFRKSNPFVDTDPDIEHPDGNNWWAEAIDAYGAWEQEVLFQDVNVGILDNGFDLSHEDLQGRITMITGNSTDAEDINHGTNVAGLIGALNNDLGIRGVASGAENSEKLHLICADWSPYTNDATNGSYVNYLSTGEYISIIQQMIEGDPLDSDDGAKVINCSWGNYAPSYWKYLNVMFDVSLEEFIEIYQEDINETARNCTWLMLQMLFKGEDFLIVQAAGNGLENGGIPFSSPVESWQSGFFCRIDEDIFNACAPDGHWNGITYEDIDNRILIVGSVQNTRNAVGDYEMAQFSNYGENVDICAPGVEIYTTRFGRYGLTEGTSMSAPIVSGAAAVLWSIAPSLTTPEVRQLLLDNHTVMAYGTGQSTGWYPMLNVGNAVEALIERLDIDKECAVIISDVNTGRPIENAEITLLDRDLLSITEDIENITGSLKTDYKLLRGWTDDSGFAAFSGLEHESYPVYISAEGYGNWTGWLDTNWETSAVETIIHDVTLRPLIEEREDELSILLDMLVSEYGVVPTGREMWQGTVGYGGGETVVPSNRIEGIVSADIHDYDSDGMDELMTVRVDTLGDYGLGWKERAVDMYIVIEIYERGCSDLEPDGQVTIPFAGLSDTIYSCSFHVVRGDQNTGENLIYLDYYWSMNSFTAGTVCLVYDGDIHLTGGVECSEFYNSVICDTALENKALETLCGQMTGTGREGWKVGTWHEGGMAEDPISFYNAYREEALAALEAIGLMDSDLRTYTDGRNSDERFVYNNAKLRPIDHFAMIDGSLTEIGGMVSVDDMGNVDFAAYDSTGILDQYR